MNPKRLYFANLASLLLPSGMHKIKSKLYRWAGVKVGKNVEFFHEAKIYGEGDVEIGDNVYIGFGASIMCNKGSKVIIEKYAAIGNYSNIVTGFHPITPNGPRIIGYEGTSSVIIVGEGAHLGMRSILLPGKKLGKMSEAAAGSLVTHDVEEYTRVGGVPARFMKNLKDL